MAVIRHWTDPVVREKARVRARDNRLRSRGRPPAIKDPALTPELQAHIVARSSSCTYCGRELAPPERTIDHVIPLELGGRHAVDNIVIACGPCNTSKGIRHAPRPRQSCATATEAT